MACSGCKKKTETKLSIKRKPILKAQKDESVHQRKPPKPSTMFDKTVTWIIVVWFILGAYGLVSIIKNIISLL